MKNFFLVFALLAIGCQTTTCAPAHHSAHAQRHQVHQVEFQTLKLHTGEAYRYAYQDDGFWFYYTVLSSNVVPTGYSVPVYTFTSVDQTGKISLPPGGNWTKSSTPPAKEEVEEREEIQVEEEASGTPTLDQTPDPVEAIDLHPEESFFGTPEPTNENTNEAPAAEAPSADTGGGGSSGGDSGGGSCGGGCGAD